MGRRLSDGVSPNSKIQHTIQNEEQGGDLAQSSTIHGHYQSEFLNNEMPYQYLNILVDITLHFIRISSKESQKK
jgi:hypothetical protein